MKQASDAAPNLDRDHQTESSSAGPLRCLDCELFCEDTESLHRHILSHIKQPLVILDKIEESHPPLKITLKNRTGNSFEIVSSPQSSVASTVEETSSDNYQSEVHQVDFEGDNLEGYNDQQETSFDSSEVVQDPENENRTSVCFSPNFAEVIGESLLGVVESPPESISHQDQSQESEDSNNIDNTAGVDALTPGNNASQEYGHIPGAEPTPPPEPSPTGAPEYPKIKIKTTGLFKDPEPERCTITEITDDNPTGDPTLAPIWTTPSLEDPLKLPDDGNFMSLFNNNDKAKDLGFSTSNENEFISLDTYNERNRGAMQLYNPNQAVSSTSASSSLDSITGLPMQALAQQVSRLQPSNAQGMHQQNVLINIQQFPTPQQPPYQHPPMYPSHPYPPHPSMNQPYQYQPPSPMYYPPGPGYPPQHPAPHMPPPPPQHQMGQMQPPPPMQQQQMGNAGQSPNSMVPSTQGQPMPPNQMQQPPNQMQGGYRPPPMPPAKPPAPRGPQNGPLRMPGGPRGGPMNARPPMPRPRGPMVRPRGAGVQPMRGQVRPRMGGPQNGIRPNGQAMNVKRNPDQANAMAKRKKLDVLTPSDKDDDDCQVICMQPKNTDGGLPQIESVQGGSESAENSIMHLSDSITLSVRNPPPKPVVSPQKSDAKAVANILATRGITVTASAKPKEKEVTKTTSSSVPTALSLNGAVSIVAKSNGASNNKSAAENLPTVDLTDDSNPPPPTTPTKKGPGLPYRCDLCPAQYPNSMGLNKHRQTYHKTSGSMSELGVPVINLKHPAMMQKLTQMGITSYIPLPAAGADGTYAIPIISTKQPGNVSALGATQMLSLGPVRMIPRPNAPSPMKK
ncbi:uncharacterized protein LOC143201699 isoform X1 [Rhynchophorus ferrugineus]|uniref:uncharacterized protein LOC143201699 isoform X1 n=1 Tax=Rhynchophorus ferrugineus TaxID=354439 RepID=UPI003FCDCEF7